MAIGDATNGSSWCSLYTPKVLSYVNDLVGRAASSGLDRSGAAESAASSAPSAPEPQQDFHEPSVSSCAPILEGRAGTVVGDAVRNAATGSCDYWRPAEAPTEAQAASYSSDFYGSSGQLLGDEARRFLGWEQVPDAPPKRAKYPVHVEVSLGKPDSALTTVEVSERSYGWPKRRPRPGYYIRQQQWLDPLGEDDEEDEEFAECGLSSCSRNRVRFSTDVDILEFTPDTPPSLEDDTTQVGLLYVIDEEGQDWEDDEFAEGIEEDEEVNEAEYFEGDEAAEGEADADAESEAEREAASDAEAEAEFEAASEAEAEAEVARALEASQDSEAEVAQKELPKACRVSQCEAAATEEMPDDLPPLMSPKEAQVLAAAEDAHYETPVDAEEPEPEAELGSGEADRLSHAVEESSVDYFKLRLPTCADTDTTDADAGDKRCEYEHRSERDRRLLLPLDSERRLLRTRHESPQDRWPTPESPLSLDTWHFNSSSALASLPLSRSDGGTPDSETVFVIPKPDVEARFTLKATLAEFRSSSSCSSPLQPFDPRGENASLDKMTPLLRLSGARKDELERQCNMTEARIEDFARLVRQGMNGRLARAILYHAGKSVGYHMESFRSGSSHSHSPWHEKLSRCEPILSNVREKMGALQSKLTKERRGAQSLGPHLVMRVVEAAYFYVVNERQRRGSGASTLSSSNCSGGASPLSGSRAMDSLQGLSSSLSSSSLRLAGAGLSLGASTTVATGWHQSRWLACIVRAGVQASNRAVLGKRVLPAAEGQELADQARLMAEWIEHWPTHVFPKNPRPRLPRPPRQLQACF